MINSFQNHRDLEPASPAPQLPDCFTKMKNSKNDEESSHYLQQQKRYNQEVF